MPSEQLAEADWQLRFRNFNVKVGISLTLTKPMIEQLCAIAQDVRVDAFWAYLHGTVSSQSASYHFASADSLVKRGLVIDLHAQPHLRLVPERNHATLPDGMPDLRDNRYQLTPAGECVVQLLKVVGLFHDADQAIARRNA